METLGDAQMFPLCLSGKKDNRANRSVLSKVDVGLYYEC